MTNADKYLKEGVTATIFVNAFENSISKKGYYFENADLLKFLGEPIKPTLTEDERVILRNIDTNTYEVIGRDTDFDLYILQESLTGTIKKYQPKII